MSSGKDSTLIHSHMAHLSASWRSSCPVANWTMCVTMEAKAPTSLHCSGPELPAEADSLLCTSRPLGPHSPPHGYQCLLYVGLLITLFPPPSSQMQCGYTSLPSSSLSCALSSLPPRCFGRPPSPPLPHSKKLSPNPNRMTTGRHLTTCRVGSQ